MMSNQIKGIERLHWLHMLTRVNKYATSPHENRSQEKSCASPAFDLALHM